MECVEPGVQIHIKEMRNLCIVFVGSIYGRRQLGG
jgi:hypothetical protein